MTKVKMLSGVFPQRVLSSALHLLDKASDVIAEAAAGVGSYDVCIGLKPYEALVVGAALASALAERNGLQTAAHFSATKYMNFKTNFEETSAGGFDSFDDVIHSDILVISELSYVPASVAADLDSIIYRRFCVGKQTVITGYNMPVESGFSAETIDGYGGYPLLAHRLNSTVIVYAKELPDEWFR